MTSYVTPKNGAAFIFYVSLVSQSNTKTFQSTPTLASGDFKVSIDGGTLNNLTTLPTNTPASSKMVKISLSASEMTGDNICVVCSDASGAEWCDLTVNIQTSARQIDDLAYPATSGRSTAIDASGQVTVGAIAANAITATAINADAITAAKIADGAIDAATFAAGAINAAAIATDAITAAKIAADAIGASELASDAVTEIQSGLALASAIVTLQADTDDIQTRLPAALVSGRIDASVGAMAANVLTATAIATDAITAAKIAADAIGASELATDAVTEIQTGLATGSGQTSILAAIAALSIPTASAIAIAVWANGTRTLSSFGTLVADIWSYVTRTTTSGAGATAAELWSYTNRSLTQTAAQVQAAMTGSDLTITRAATFTATLTGLDIPSTWTALYFTAKRALGSVDTDATLQIVKSNPGAGSDGLLRLNGAAGTAGQGSLTVDAVAGTVAIVIADNATVSLAQRGIPYDLKVLLSDGTSQILTSATLYVDLTPTETI